MAEFNKSVVEKKAKELEANIGLKTESASLKRYLARVKACNELYKADAPAVIGVMITKLYKPGQGTPRSWASELEAAGEKEALGYLTAGLGPVAPEPPKPVAPEGEKKGRGKKASATPATPGGQPPVAPPAPPPEASSELDALVGGQPTA